MILNFRVQEQTLFAPHSFTPHSPIIVSRSQDYLKARFNFTEDWNKTQKIAQFVRGDLKYNIMLDNTNSCLVPWELLLTEGSFSVTVWANNYPNEDNLIITTNKVIVVVHPDGLDDDLLPTEPTEGVEGSILTQCQEAVELSKDWATKTDGTVGDTDEYSAKYYAQQAEQIAEQLASMPHFVFENDELYLVYGG